MARDTTTTMPFRDALTELLRDTDEYTTQTGNVNWHAFARELDGLHYETLRKVLAGHRSVTPHVMEECARVLRIKPDYFVEWRAIEAARNFDVGALGFEQVLENLEQWSKMAAAQTAGAMRRRRPR